jgi:hypothetical protein
MVCQSVYLLGSIWFRKLAFLKTVLWITIFATGAAAVAAVAARILMADHLVWNQVQAGSHRVGGWSLNLSDQSLQTVFAPGSRGYGGLMIFKRIADVLFYGVLAPVCWLASYFRLKETEV